MRTRLIRDAASFGGWGQNELMDSFLDYQADCIEAIQQGINPRTGQPFDGQLLEAFQDGRLQAAIENGVTDLLEAAGMADFKGFLWEPIRAAFYVAYQNRAGGFKAYTAKKSVPTFDIYRLKGANGMTRIAHIGESGRYIEMTRSFRPETGVAVDTYGATYGITRKLAKTEGAADILSRIPADMGEAMADFITAMIVSFIVANPTAPDGLAMFHSSHGNISTAAITESSVIDVATWLAMQKDDDGRPIQASLQTAVVQNPRQRAKLLQILKSNTLEIDTMGSGAMAATAFGRGTMNPIPSLGLINPANIIEDPYLPDAEDIYWFADPNRMPAFVVAYLDGNEEPFLGQAMPQVRAIAGGAGSDPYSFHEDSIDYKIRHDIGCQAVEWRGAYKSSPA